MTLLLVVDDFYYEINADLIGLQHEFLDLRKSAEQFISHAE